MVALAIYFAKFPGINPMKLRKKSFPNGGLFTLNESEFFSLIFVAVQYEH